MRVSLTIAIGISAGCGFRGGGETPAPDAPPDGSTIDMMVDVGPDSNIDSPPDAPCAYTWPYTPTNFEACDLLAPMPMTFAGAMTVDTNGLTGTEITQPGGAKAVVVHLDTMTIPNDATITFTGSRGVIFAVDGNVQIQGIVTVKTGALACSGGGGGDSLGVGGGGGAAGGGGATKSGDGSSGSGVLAGGGGQHQSAISQGDLVSPLRGGCRGPAGGLAGLSPGANGGNGGGALQITSKTQIQIDAVLSAAAEGGHGAGGNAGGGGGGAGGALLFEAPLVQVSAGSIVCADGGSGGQGGGSVTGADGSPGKCDGATGATTMNATNGGGNGGSGGAKSIAPGDAGPSNGSRGGGGGGGAAGFIRLIAVGGSPQIDGAAIVTPDPRTN